MLTTSRNRAAAEVAAPIGPERRDRTRCNRGVTARVAAALALAALAFPGVSGAATPAACAEPQSRATVKAFVEAFNGGDLARLDRLFAAWPLFEWYSSNKPGRRVGDAAGTRETLVAYFAARHRIGDQLRLVRFDYNGVTGEYGNFGVTFRRSAADYRTGAWFELAAKGAIACEGGKLIVLSLGGPQPRR